MQPLNQNTKQKQILLLKPQDVSRFIRELGRLIQSKQVELATLLSAADGTISRWENDRLQLSLQGLKKINPVLADLVNSPEPELHKLGKDLLVQYCSVAE